jgi:hypothetical protein
MAGNGGGSGDMIVGSEGSGGGEGGAEDPDVVVKGGGWAGTVEEEGEFVLRADAHCGKLSDVDTILLGLFVTPLGDGSLIEADRDASNFEAGVDNSGS